ncbi:MAG: hypothetical protein DI543_07410, partial [Bradyrhizobium icense]
MWQLILGQMMREIEGQAAKQAAWGAGKGLASLLLGQANKPEAYADRINREFNLRNYAKAWALYDSDRAYWEKLYGDDPLNSPNHPASPPKSLLPRQPGASASAYNFLDPATRDANTLGLFGTGGQFVAVSAVSSRPLYEMQSPIPPPGSTPPEAAGDNKSVRRLGVRIGDTPNATVFDFGAPAVPFASPNPIELAGRPAAFDERFPGPEDLETFR